MHRKSKQTEISFSVDKLNLFPSTKIIFFRNVINLVQVLSFHSLLPFFLPLNSFSLLIFLSVTILRRLKCSSEVEGLMSCTRVMPCFSTEDSAKSNALKIDREKDKRQEDKKTEDHEKL